MEYRRLGTNKNGEMVGIEPYCYECAIDWDGSGHCACGLSMEEREASGWKLDGVALKKQAKRAAPRSG